VEDKTRPAGGRVVWGEMMDKEKLKAFLLEMKEQADEVEASTGEQPTAQEAIGWIIDWIEDQSFPK